MNLPRVQLMPKPDHPTAPTDLVEREPGRATTVIWKNRPPLSRLIALAIALAYIAFLVFMIVEMFG